MAEFNYYYLKNFFDKSKIKEINYFIEKNFDFIEDKNDGAIDKDGDSKKKLIAKQIYWKKIKHFFIDLESELYFINQKYFGYNLYNMNNNTLTLLNTYDSKNKDSYDWHLDKSRSNTFDTKLTILINLSMQNYKGGEFELNAGNPEIIKEFNEPGDVLMFQSFTLHKVNPVIEGVRKSLVFWLTGPCFR